MWSASAAVRSLLPTSPRRSSTAGSGYLLLFALRRARARGRHAKARDARRASLRIVGPDWPACDLRSVRRLPDDCGGLSGFVSAGSGALNPKARRLPSDQATTRKISSREVWPMPTLRRPSSRSAQHALHDRHLLDVLGRAPLDDQALDLLGDRHHLVEREPAAVAGAPARRAADRLVQRRPLAAGGVLERPARRRRARPRSAGTAPCTCRRAGGRGAGRRRSRARS